MSYAAFGHRPIVRIVAICLVVLTTIALSIGDADARRKKKRIGHGYQPALSHIVLDAKTGKTLEAYKADERRYPASLTKIMTLYLLFEQMEAGKFSLNSRLPVSRYAASRPPTKLRLQPGSTIRVEDAIKALVTKSANDAAVVVAEAIGGSESEFARMMTSKARALGMSGTTYANASGLPNPRQVTTARDQAILGRAIQRKFPRQYRYFATSSFRFRGRNIHNHNRLLGQVKGVDGIKTGYIRASGFNLVTSVRRNHRHIVAVVIGGRTGRSRDAFMRKLIRDYIDDASTVRSAQHRSALPVGVVDQDNLPVPPARPDEDAVAEADPPELATASTEPASGPSQKKQMGAEPAASTAPAAANAVGNVSKKDADSATPSPAASGAAAKAATATANVVQATIAPTFVRQQVKSQSQARLARPALPAIPEWFPYLIVAFIGCLGSLLSAFFTVVPLRWRRRLPDAA